MDAREIRFNWFLSTLATTAGALCWIVCALGLRKGFLLPEYALSWKGVGQAVFALGLIWMALTTLKKLLSS